MAVRKKLSLVEAVAYCLDSDIDSCTGGLTTDEELEIVQKCQIIIIVLQMKGKFLIL